jgi:hypothetical protein
LSWPTFPVEDHKFGGIRQEAFLLSRQEVQKPEKDSSTTTILKPE